MKYFSLDQDISHPRGSTVTCRWPRQEEDRFLSIEIVLHCLVSLIRNMFCLSTQEKDARYSLLGDSERNRSGKSRGREEPTSPAAKLRPLHSVRLILVPIGLFLVALVAVMLLVVAAIPTSKGCTNPRIRYEWRALKAADRLEYLEAVKCLTRKQ